MSRVTECCLQYLLHCCALGARLQCLKAAMQLWYSLSQACSAIHVWDTRPMLGASTHVQEQHVVNLLLPNMYKP